MIQLAARLIAHFLALVFAEYASLTQEGEVSVDLTDIDPPFGFGSHEVVDEDDDGEPQA